jgi:hypothetical protein
VAVELFVYADESGIHKQARYCVMGGYIGSPQQWARFGKDWRAALSSEGVPDFHSKDFFAANRRNSLACYKGWSARRRIAFVENLSMAIDRYRLTPVCGAINVSAFNALTYGERRFLTGGAYTRRGKWLSQGAPTRPYRFAAFQMIRDAIERAKDGTTVHFVFDQQTAFEGGMRQEFEDMIASGMGADKIIDTTKLGRLSHSTRQIDVPLQAADLFAHCWHHQLQHGAHKTPERAAAMSILSRKRGGIFVFNAEDFEQFFDESAAYGINRDLLRRMGPRGLRDG